MDSFDVGKEFNDFQSVLVAKRNCEIASNTILVTRGSHKMKGESDLASLFVYDILVYACKAGKERQTQSKGVRCSSTFKLDCPFQVTLSLVKGKMTVKNINPNHENHKTDKQTFACYPENVRLTETETAVAKKMINCGASKQRLKAFLMKDRKSPVSLKSLHNLQTKIHSEKQSSNENSDLKNLIEMMLTVENATVRIITNEETDELVGVYFQDQRMSYVYEKYPEILFYDATHNLNNSNMPQLCVDGNGDSEIVSLFICKSESREGIGSMIDVFKTLNPQWTKTKVILGDKDFADRAVYTEKFDDVVLLICLFHVQRTFKREITVPKRDITNAQRDVVLEILRRLVYSISEEEYDLVYNELIGLNLKHVTSYYNENWHSIRGEWTLYGLNQHCSFLNATNNRLESLNQKLKLIGNRHANLQTFFENLSISISNLSSEKDLTAVRGTMRRSRQRFDDPVLTLYNDFLTPFIFDKIKEQYNLAQQVEFLSIDHEKGIVEANQNYITTRTSCTCLFFSSMSLPCRHILKFLIVTNGDPYAPQLCSNRWTKAYYNSSHPALCSEVQITHQPPAYVKVRVPNEVDRFKKSATVTKEINNIAASLTTGRHTYFMEKLEDLKNEMINSSSVGNTINILEDITDDASEHSVEIPLNLSMKKPNTSEKNVEIPADLSIEKPLEPDTVDTSKISSISNIRVAEFTVLSNSGKENISSIENNHSPFSDVHVESSIIKQSGSIAVLSSIDNIRMPQKSLQPGRSKHSSTVIGLKRKRKDYVSTASRKITHDIRIRKKGFFFKSKDEQALIILEWITNKDASSILQKKINLKDIVEDNNVLQRLRNDDIFLGSLKKYVNVKCFEFIKQKVIQMYDQPWNCSQCSLELSGLQVMCDNCLDWFHSKCFNFVNSSKKDFFCDSCK